MKPTLNSQAGLLFQLVKKREKQGVVKIVGVLDRKDPRRENKRDRLGEDEK